MYAAKTRGVMKSAPREKPGLPLLNVPSWSKRLRAGWAKAVRPRPWQQGGSGSTPTPESVQGGLAGLQRARRVQSGRRRGCRCGHDTY